MDSMYTEEHLGRKAFVLFALERMQIALSTLVIALVLSIFADGTHSEMLDYIVSDLYFLSFVAFLVTLGWTWLLYENYTFTFGEFNLTMRSGVINKKEITIPYRQIQSVDVVRSILHQALALSKLIIYTGGEQDVGEKQMTKIILEPIERARAGEIRDMLDRKVGIQIVKDVKEADAEALQTKAHTT